ncbi:small acid-soluble spore protein H (minor) [Marininema mesophilum]|uniref:Small acid-soluble spore protein H (Minor) n=1 Tax=Marininema mesophilum TaxID=1048340 RepID=A0A1H2UEB2_9BACL|nr:H-type small acid-soluble spore protein [Marininema mesophilum]SDW54491.1 small acid-soluble spore protein H (minor) [Marininema mesophilum]
MDIQRAKQIIESPKEIEVRYQNTPVWIQNINESAQTARVYTGDQPDREMEVSVRELTE